MDTSLNNAYNQHQVSYSPFSMINNQTPSGYSMQPSIYNYQSPKPVSVTPIPDYSNYNNYLYQSSIPSNNDNYSSYYSKPQDYSLNTSGYFTNYNTSNVPRANATSTPVHSGVIESNVSTGYQNYQAKQNSKPSEPTYSYDIFNSKCKRFFIKLDISLKA